jgi:hypothetical protein
MRALAVIAGAVLAASAIAAHAETPVATTGSAPHPILAYYPWAALAAHVNGEAVLKCGRTEHGAMSDCQLVSEKPAGQGFGAAALAIAAKSKEAPAAEISAEHRRVREVTFSFSPDGPCITPDVVSELWMPIQPRFAHFPDETEIYRVWDQEGGGFMGRVKLSCKAGGDNRLTKCEVISESPKGYGFGKVALTLTRDIVLRPTAPDGVPVAGQTIVIDWPFTRPRTVGYQ